MIITGTSTPNTHTALNQHWSVGLERERKNKKKTNTATHKQQSSRHPQTWNPPQKNSNESLWKGMSVVNHETHSGWWVVCVCRLFFFPWEEEEESKKSFLGGMRLTHTHTHTSITDYSGRRNERDPSSHGDFITHTHTRVGGFPVRTQCFRRRLDGVPFLSTREWESLALLLLLPVHTIPRRERWLGGIFKALYSSSSFFSVCVVNCEGRLRAELGPPAAEQYTGRAI